MHLDIDTLLVHEPFIRRIAGALLRGDPRVDDVVQQTLVVALDGGPRRPAALRAWLAGIARNLARGMIRSDAARVRTERRAARPETAPSAVSIAVTEEIRR